MVTAESAILCGEGNSFYLGGKGVLPVSFYTEPSFALESSGGKVYHDYSFAVTNDMKSSQYSITIRGSHNLNKGELSFYIPLSKGTGARVIFSFIGVYIYSPNLEIFPADDRYLTCDFGLVITRDANSNKFAISVTQTAGELSRSQTVLYTADQGYDSEYRTELFSNNGYRSTAIIDEVHFTGTDFPTLPEVEGYPFRDGDIQPVEGLTIATGEAVTRPPLDTIARSYDAGLVFNSAIATVRTYITSNKPGIIGLALATNAQVVKVNASGNATEGIEFGLGTSNTSLVTTEKHPEWYDIDLDISLNYDNLSGIATVDISGGGVTDSVAYTFAPADITQIIYGCTFGRYEILDLYVVAPDQDKSIYLGVEATPFELADIETYQTTALIDSEGSFSGPIPYGSRLRYDYDYDMLGASIDATHRITCEKDMYEYAKIHYIGSGPTYHRDRLVFAFRQNGLALLVVGGTNLFDNRTIDMTVEHTIRMVAKFDAEKTGVDVGVDFTAYFDGELVFSGRDFVQFEQPDHCRITVMNNARYNYDYTNVVFESIKISLPAPTLPFQCLGSPIPLDFTAIKTEGEAPFVVQLISAKIPNASWSFGDGNSSKKPIHCYDKAGTYTVALSGSGREEVKEAYITVTEPESFQSTEELFLQQFKEDR